MKAILTAAGLLVLGLLLNPTPSHAQINININPRPYGPGYVLVGEPRHVKKWKGPKGPKGGRVLLVPGGPVFIDDRGHGRGHGHGRGWH